MSTSRGLALAALSLSVGLGCGQHASRLQKASTTTGSATAAPTSAAPAATTSATSGAVSSASSGPVSSATAAPATSSQPASPLPPADDHGNDPASATALIHASPFAGEIEVQGDVDCFGFTLQAGVAYDLKTFTRDDTTLELRDAAGTTLDFNDDEGAGSLASRIASFVPVSAGTYYAYVRGFQTATPRYVLRVYPSAVTLMPRLTQAALIDVDRSGGASQGDQLLLAFSEPVVRASQNASGRAADDFALPVANDAFGVGATVALGPGPDQAVITLGPAPTLTVAGETDGRRRGAGDPSGVDVALSNLLSSARNSLPPARWVVDLSDGGVVPVVLPSLPGTTGTTSTGSTGATAPAPGDDHGNDPASATAAVLTSPFGGRIEVAGDVDCFAVDLRAGFPYLFRTETQDDTSLELLDASGQSLAFNDDAAPGTLRSEISWVAAAAGPHFLLVRGSRGALPTYTLRSVIRGALLLPRLISARFVDRDGSGGPSAGDHVEATFSEPVALAPLPSGAALAADDHFELLVRNDLFGTGATVQPGPNPDQVTLVLGTGASLTVAGRFDGSRLTAGSPSGLDVDLLTRVAASTGSASGSRATRWPIDIE